MSHQQTTPLTILRRKQVEEKTGLSRSAIYKGVKNGRFPSPIFLAPKAVGWIESEIDAWIMARMTSRAAPQTAHA